MKYCIYMEFAAAEKTPGLLDRLGIDSITVLHDPGHAVKNIRKHLQSAKQGKSSIK